MGKGFQNFMSKKDFHPSAFRNLKMVWEARQKKSLDDKRQEELRVMYEKEQEILNNKALLGDEKAKMGLSFMYDAPAGMTKREEPKEEPKFEWQRKYQAPREDWAKGNEDITDQPFGIQVKNVRCCKCHKWGHINTDNECPLYGKSGNFEDEGYANNPSDLIKDLRRQRQNGTNRVKTNNRTDKSEVEEEEWMDHQQLANDMREEHGIVLKGNVLAGMQQDQQLSAMRREKTEEEQMLEFFNTMSDKDKRKLMKKLISGESLEDAMAKKEKKQKKKEKKMKKKAKKSKKSKKSDSSEEDSESDEDEWEEKKRRVKREVESSPEYSKEADNSSRRRNESRTSSRRDDRHRESERRRREVSRSRSPRNRRERSRSPRRLDNSKRRRHDSDSDERSKSRSRSPVRRRETQRKRHDSKSSRSRSRSPVRRRQRSDSRSPVRENRRKVSRSRSPVRRRGRSDSRSPVKQNGGRKRHDSDSDSDEKSRSRSPVRRRETQRRSRSRDGSRDRRRR